MGPPVPEMVHCPHCQALNPAIEDRCQSCGRPLAIYIGPAPSLPRRFSLGSLMILIALIAVGLGLTREVPGLGILYLVLVVPALMRTLGLIAVRKADGRPMTLAEGLGALLASLGLMMFMGVAACFAFTGAFFFGVIVGEVVGSLWPGTSFGWELGVGIPLGLSAALYVLYRMARQLWNQWD